MRAAVALACSLGCGIAGMGSAPAQDRPPALPLRDVDVTYRSEAGGQALQQRSRFAVQSQRMRLDTPTPGVYMIVDYRARTMAVVSDIDHGVLDTTAPAGVAPGVDPGAGYVRRGGDTVAGLPCIEWETRDLQGQAALACFTADGVMLRVRRGQVVLAVATRVAYGPIDPALFAVPPGYARVVGRTSR